MKGVTFTIGEEWYVLPVEAVREVLEDQELTEVPNLPDFLKGIFHLRNQVIPVVEAAERMGYPEAAVPAQGEGNILVLDYRQQLVGMRVHEAYRVEEFEPNQIRRSPQMVESMGADFVSAVIEPNDEDEGQDTSAQWNFQDDLEQGVQDLGQDDPGNEADDDTPDSIMVLNLNELFSSYELDVIDQATESTSSEPG